MQLSLTGRRLGALVFLAAAISMTAISILATNGESVPDLLSAEVQFSAALVISTIGV